MNKNPRVKQYRWRVSPQTANHLEHLRTQQGYKSWDDFFQAVLQNGNIPEAFLAPKEPDLTEEFERLQVKCKEIHEMIENLENVSLKQSEQTLQILSLMRAIHDLLQIASSEEEPKQTPKQESKVDEFLRKHGYS